MNESADSSLWQHFLNQKNVAETVPKTIQGFSIGNEDRESEIRPPFANIWQLIKP